MPGVQRQRSRILLCLVALALVVFQTASSANHSWGGYHWARTANPFTLKVGNNVSSVWQSILNTTASDWTLSEVLDLTVVPGQAKGRNCRPSSGRVEVCNAAYGQNGWLGIAQIWVSGSHITQGAVKLNDTYFNTSTYNSTAWRNLVSCQEVGHTLGLDHQDENFDNPNLGSCMDYTSDPSTNQHPNQHDYEQLAQIYAHVDSDTTVGSLPPPAMGQIDLDGPGQWGRQVRGNRRAAVYELDFGGGHKVITFVIWA